MNLFVLYSGKHNLANSESALFAKIKTIFRHIDTLEISTCDPSQK